MTLTPHVAGWAFCIVCVLAALGLAGFAALRAFLDVRALKKRLNGYGDLPMARAAADTQARVAVMQARLEGIQPLLDRAMIALESIRAGIARLAALAALFGTTRSEAVAAVTTVRDAVALFGPPSRNR